MGANLQQRNHGHWFTFHFIVNMFDAYYILSFIGIVVSHLNRHLGKSWPGLPSLSLPRAVKL